MNPKVILVDFAASVKSWYRSKGTLFWSLLFPIMLILIFGAIFSGVGDTKYTLPVQDLDNSSWSHTFVGTLNNISVFKVEKISTDENISAYVKDKNLAGALVIPKGFGDTISRSFIDKNVSVNVSFYYDPSSSSASVIQSIVTSTLQEYNMHLSGGHRIIGVNQVSTIGKKFNYIDFFVPGMIGFTLMQTCIYGSIERNTKYRKDGILRKLLTMPVTRTEWILAKMLFMLFLSFVSTVAIIIVGILVWGMTVNINPIMIVIIIANSFLFSGLGMVISRFVKEEETADMAGGAISFPMMFLAGTFFPMEQMPQFLQTFAHVLPLYYVNEGLRNAMIQLDFGKAAFNGGIVIIFALVFFIAGVLLTKWKED